MILLMIPCQDHEGVLDPSQVSHSLNYNNYLILIPFIHNYKLHYFSDLSLSSSSGPTSPWGQQIQQQPPPQATSIQTSSSPEKSTEQQHNR